MTALKTQKTASIGIRIHVLYVKWCSILKYRIMVQSSQSTSGEVEVEGRGQGQRAEGRGQRAEGRGQGRGRQVSCIQVQPVLTLRSEEKMKLLLQSWKSYFGRKKKMLFIRFG